VLLVTPHCDGCHTRDLRLQSRSLSWRSRRYLTFENADRGEAIPQCPLSGFLRNHLYRVVLLDSLSAHCRDFHRPQRPDLLHEKIASAEGQIFNCYTFVCP
jgi:hypothetical protein